MKDKSVGLKEPKNMKIKHKNKTGALWLAPLLLLCMAVLVFTIACQPYIDLARSALKVYLVDPQAKVADAAAVSTSGGEYPTFGNQFATIEIDSIGLFFPVYQGDTPETLSKGVCHYYGSKFPGDGENIVLDAHRTTHFASLGSVKAGDQVSLATGWGTYVYQVTDAQVVDTAHEMDFCQRTGKEQLTLITCYPFDFIGSAPQRYIVTCNLVQGTHHDWGF
jgi:sortase A